MTVIFIVYIIIGALVYGFTDTTEVAGKLSRPLLGPSFGAAREFVFLGVVALWPLWLVYLFFRSET